MYNLKKIIIIFLLLCWSTTTNAEEIPDKLAIRAIIGEASNQGYYGMLVLAVGIRNRGYLNGVYGLKAKHIDTEPEWVWKLARKAWKESKDNRIHSGTHWENIKEFGEPSWVDSMKMIYEYKDHVFYKKR